MEFFRNLLNSDSGNGSGGGGGGGSKAAADTTAKAVDDLYRLVVEERAFRKRRRGKLPAKPAEAPTAALPPEAYEAPETLVHAILLFVVCAFRATVEVLKAAFVTTLQSKLLAHAREGRRHIVFGGGGFKGVAFVEMLKGLVDYSKTEWARFDRGLRVVSGVSVGAVTAAAVAVRASPWQLDDFIARKGTGRILKIGGKRSFKRKGILDPSGLKEMVREMLRSFCGDEKITLGEVRERYQRDLRIYAANLWEQRLEVFSADTRPRMPVWRAVMMSAALPPYFPPVMYKGSLYADGGIFRHSPGIGEDAVSPQDSLFFYLREPVTRGSDLKSYIMLILRSIQQAQTLFVETHWPEYKAVTVTCVASRSTFSLLTADLKARTRKVIQKDGHMALRRWMEVPLAAAIFFMEAAVRRKEVRAAVPAFCLP